MDDCYIKLCVAIVAQARRDYEGCVTRLARSLRKGKKGRLTDAYMYRSLKEFWQTGANGMISNDLLEEINEMLKVDTKRLDDITDGLAEIYEAYMQKVGESGMKGISYCRSSKSWRVNVNSTFCGLRKTLEEARELRDEVLREAENIERGQMV